VAVSRAYPTHLAGYGKMKTGHVGPHILRDIYYPELSGYFKESKPSSESVPIQEPTPLVCKEGPRLQTWK
jgi:hypothetical protein